jgi:hypothetical protein
LGREATQKELDGKGEAPAEGQRAGHGLQRAGEEGERGDQTGEEELGDEEGLVEASMRVVQKAESANM